MWIGESVCEVCMCTYEMCVVEMTYLVVSMCTHKHSLLAPSFFFSWGITGLLSPAVAGGSSRNMVSWA